MVDMFQNEVFKVCINLKFVLYIGGVQKKVELFFKLFIVGDFSNGKESWLLFERKKINVNKNNFNSVFLEFNLEVNMMVLNMLVGECMEENVMLCFLDMKDFEFEQVV